MKRLMAIGLVALACTLPALDALAFLTGQPGGNGRGAYTGQNSNAGRGIHGRDQHGNDLFLGPLPPAHTRSLTPRQRQYRDYQDANSGGNRDRYNGCEGCGKNH